ncbi:MAG TPA: hypothetical protein VGD78_18690 [Chthoniobacterales bacterium]
MNGIWKNCTSALESEAFGIDYVRMRTVAALILLLAFSSRSSPAEQILEGFTTVSGTGFAFELKAPRGWFLDDGAAHEQGLKVVFYPRDTSWDSSPAVCYVQVRTLDNRVRRVEDQVQDTLQNLRQHGEATPRARLLRVITTQDASKAQVYQITGIQSGTEEAVAYVQGKSSIHFITLSARDPAAFKTAWAAFESLVSSYEDLTQPAPANG